MFAVCAKLCSRVIARFVVILLVTSGSSSAQAHAGREALGPIVQYFQDEVDSPRDYLPEGNLLLKTGIRNHGPFLKDQSADRIVGNFHGRDDELELSLQSYGVKDNMEVGVYFQGEFLGYLPPSPGSVPGDTVIFRLPLSAQTPDYFNTLEFRRRPGSTGQWGVGDVRLLPANPASRRTLFGLPVVTAAEWNQTAVRRVLHALCFGSKVADEQLDLWADMDPVLAVEEMVTADRRNLKLSPHAGDYRLPNRALTMAGFVDHLSSGSASLPIRKADRDLFRDGFRFYNVWPRMQIAWGMNPCRQRIGFWETNYHMAVNLRTAVNFVQLVRYYDLIMDAHADGLRYEQVVAEAALSAAVAEQYQHSLNRWDPVTETFYGNEDFAREIHQLFFGILGEQDPMGPDHHEIVTIKNTARALTDIRVQEDDEGNKTGEVVYGTEFHYPSALPLHILNADITGANARERIEQLAAVAIQHPESLANLPVMIIRGLMDDTLTTDKIDMIRTAWAAMSEKNLLQFIRAYAVSTLFHDKDSVRLATSFDRFLTQVNKLTLNNNEALRLADSLVPEGYREDDVEVFEPSHNVFGAQRPVEAADSGAVFQSGYDYSTRLHAVYERTDCTACANGRSWQRDWTAVIPPGPDGTYRAEDVAVWLWNRFLEDGLHYYDAFSRAHLLALLTSDRDLPLLLAIRQARLDNELPVSLDALLSEPEGEIDLSPYEHILAGLIPAELVDSSAFKLLVDALGETGLALDSNDETERRSANRRVGQAINFILALPFNFASGGHL